MIAGPHAGHVSAVQGEAVPHTGVAVNDTSFDDSVEMHHAQPPLPHVPAESRADGVSTPKAV